MTKTARAHRMFGTGETVLVACSGGPDSVCLLYALAHLQKLFGIRLQVFHFDHGLRSDSSADAVYVRRLAGRLDLAFHLRVADDRPAGGTSVEAWARDRRHAAAASVARAVEAAAIATAHTSDDQAETVLAWTLMGDGSRAIRPMTGPYVRPLLDCSREEVEAFCRALRLRPRRDPMNEDRRFLRATVRLDVIPALERATGRGVRGALARSARRTLEDDEELTRLMLERWDEVVEERADEIRLLAAPLRALPPPIARRLVERAVRLCGRPATLADVDAIVDLAGGRPGRRRDLSSGSTARRDRVYLSLSRTSPESRA